MSTFLADSLRDIRRLCDHARVSLDQSSSVNISGNFWRLQHFLAHSVCLCWVRNRLLWSLQFIRIDQVSSFSVIIEQFHNSSLDKVPVANS